MFSWGVVTCNMAARRVDLFGGAIRADLPPWLDASDVRPVPDHQEVYTERDEGERCLVVEILERADCQDAACAAMHFEELAVGNDAAVGATVAPSSRRAASALHPTLRAEGSCSCFTLSGLQRLPATEGSSDCRQLLVSLAVLRIEAQSTDLLVSICRPLGQIPHSAGHEEQGATGVDDASPLREAARLDEELLLRVLGSLEIADWGLFGGGP